jgi:hypothetical protein
MSNRSAEDIGPAGLNGGLAERRRKHRGAEPGPLSGKHHLSGKYEAATKMKWTHGARGEGRGI